MNTNLLHAETFSCENGSETLQILSAEPKRGANLTAAGPATAPHLGDLWDLGGVDGPAVLGHGHSVPGLFPLHALIS